MINNAENVILTKEVAEELDLNDPLAGLRDFFFFQGEKLYFDGNSLGRMPKDILARMEDFLREERGKRLVDGRDAWLNLGVQLGDSIGAYILGAKQGETIVSDSVTINLYKLLGSLFLNETRTVVTHQGNFPTDKYICDSMQQLFEGGSSERIEDAFMSGVTPEDMRKKLEELGERGRGSVFLISHVDYRSGALTDMRAINRIAHSAGAVVIRDLCHSAGVVPINFDDNECDYAVGCTYKYLNAGPGGPAFVSVAERHIPTLKAIIPGRWSQRPDDQFAFHEHHRAAPDIRVLQTGTPSILAMQPLISTLDIYKQTTIADIRLKSKMLTDFAQRLLIQELGDNDVEIITPTDGEQRGSHISFTHQHAREIAVALRANNVIPDFRPPNIVRVGIAPLYTSYEDVFEFVERLKKIIRGEEYIGVVSESIVT